MSNQRLLLVARLALTGCVLTALLLSSCISQTHQRLVPLLHLPDLFTMPESAVIDPQQRWIYVSNVNGYAKDSNGFLSRLSLDGSKVDLHWLEGLHSPTGMAIYNDRLFVADFDALVEVNLQTGQITARYPAPDTNPALNDVAVSPAGEVYVSGSASNSIYVLQHNGLVLWLHDDEYLLQANGLLIEENRLIHGGRFWTVFDRDSKAVLLEQTDVFGNSEQFRDFDGITADGCGGYLFTLIDDGRIWQLGAGGDTQSLSDFHVNGIDLFQVDGLLAVPRVLDSFSLYEFPHKECNFS